MELKNTKLINCKSVNFYPKLIQQYIDNELKNKQIVDFDYSENELKRQLKNRSYSAEQRAVLVNALQKQYQGFDLTNAEKNNLAHLNNSNCFTITTGHQLVLLGGPLFFYSKILDVVQLAKKMSSASNHVVPIFWMASEDHDFEEIASVRIFGKKITAAGNNKGPVGRLKNSVFKEFLTEIKALLQNDDRYSVIVELISTAFESGKNLSEITRIFVRFFFKDEGVLIIDGDDENLKRLFIPAIKAELTNQTLFKATQDVLQNFNNEGFKIQVNPREINLFFIQDGLRERIVPSEKGFKTVNNTHSWSHDELLKLVDEQPQCFSPNAVLRPVYQEVILPNIAYVGGAGEIAYWLELPKAFKAFGIHFPMPIVRKSYIVVQHKLLQWLTDNAWDLSSLFKIPELLEKEFAEKIADDTVKLTNEISELTVFFDKLKVKGESIAPQMAKVVLGEQKRAISALENVEKRFLNAEKQKHDQQLNKLLNIQERVLPNQKPMERGESFLPLFVNPSLDLKKALVNYTNVFDGGLAVVTF